MKVNKVIIKRVVINVNIDNTSETSQSNSGLKDAIIGAVAGMAGSALFSKFTQKPEPEIKSNTNSNDFFPEQMFAFVQLLEPNLLSQFVNKDTKNSTDISVRHNTTGLEAKGKFYGIVPQGFAIKQGGNKYIKYEFDEDITIWVNKIVDRSSMIVPGISAHHFVETTKEGTVLLVYRKKTGNWYAGRFAEVIDDDVMLHSWENGMSGTTGFSFYDPDNCFFKLPPKEA